ncbi:MAG: rod shape-determining protein MreD [Actinobacteria bacterium]|nr:rod shape-determining protein MreD [Actinomycetota bacterium]MBU1493868.1 rod shape-determining protein MreD [Actinomycetota bacterium]MBU1866324.1 rod shape-determining protein MreD [Actinomycetota bacterium]
MTRRILWASALIVAAVALQTTLFADLRPLDAAPALALLALIGAGRHMREQPALLVGFGSGLLLDLLSESPLGLWALVHTVVIFVVVRFRERTEDDPLILGFGVFLLTAGALTLFAILGTIFGEKTLADASIVRKIVLPAAYNTVLAAAVLPGASRLMGAHRRSGWDL